MFDYRATWRTNNSIISSFIGCLVRAKVGRGDIVKLCYDIFSPVWRKGLEKAIYDIDEKFQIPLPKKYMSPPLGVIDLDIAPWR